MFNVKINDGFKMMVYQFDSLIEAKNFIEEIEERNSNGSANDPYYIQTAIIAVYDDDGEFYKL
jgi:hypothetical protein